jgi:hypothetical protein
MPRVNGTGPRGMGPMTGHGAGFCAGFAMPANENPMPGRGLGIGFGGSRGAWSRGFGGGGRGCRNMFYATGQPGWMRFGATAAPVANFDPEMEKQALKNQADYLQGELNLIRKRLEEVEKEAGQQ